jgi:hypothetical protein
MDRRSVDVWQRSKRVAILAVKKGRESCDDWVPTVSGLLALLDPKVEGTAFSEQTAIISLHNFNLLAFITQTECLKFAIPCIIIHFK